MFVQISLALFLHEDASGSHLFIDIQYLPSACAHWSCPSEPSLSKESIWCNSRADGPEGREIAGKRVTGACNLLQQLAHVSIAKSSLFPV